MGGHRERRPAFAWAKIQSKSVEIAVYPKYVNARENAHSGFLNYLSNYPKLLIRGNMKPVIVIIMQGSYYLDLL